MNTDRPLRRASDEHGWYRVWISLPLVDYRTGEWSLSRTLAALFAFATVHLMEEQMHSHDLTWPGVTLVVCSMGLTIAAAFGQKIFLSVAEWIAGRTTRVIPSSSPPESQ